MQHRKHIIYLAPALGATPQEEEEEEEEEEGGFPLKELIVERDGSACLKEPPSFRGLPKPTH